VRLCAYGLHEPYESRGSRTDLWGTGGEIPPVYPAKSGVGSFLLEAMEDFLIKSGVSFIVLETLEGRDGAKLFFLKHGYTEAKFLPNYYSYGDGVRMKKITAEKSKPGESI